MKFKPDLPDGTVLIHMFKRGPFAPSMSPFILKLETFCRINKIPFETDDEHPFSSKGKTPWMQYKGRVVADSQFCLEALKADLGPGVDLDAHLDPERVAVARGFFHLIETDLAFLGQESRFQRSAAEVAKHWKAVPAFVTKYVLPVTMKKASRAHGVGRHSADEQMAIFRKDLDALSTYLGEKPYLMGSRVAEIDCSLFGTMAQFIYHDFEGRHKAYVEEHCENLVRYTERMREEFWSDWPLE